MGKKSSQYKKILGAFFICLIAFGIILAQYYIRQKTTTKSQAAKTAVLSFSQPQKPVNAGDTFNVDVMLTPGNNKITAVKLVIGYNPNILEQGNPGLIPNTNVFPQIFEG